MVDEKVQTEKADTPQDVAYQALAEKVGSLETAVAKLVKAQEEFLKAQPKNEDEKNEDKKPEDEKTEKKSEEGTIPAKKSEVSSAVPAPAPADIEKLVQERVQAELAKNANAVKKSVADPTVSLSDGAGAGQGITMYDLSKMDKKVFNQMVEDLIRKMETKQ